MTPDQKEDFRDLILLCLEAGAPFPLPLSRIHRHVKLQGYSMGSEELMPHIDYMIQKGWIVAERSEIAAGVVRWKLTAAGREYLEAKGLC